MGKAGPCQYLNEHWCPGWGQEFHERSAGPIDPSICEIRCTKPHKFGVRSEKLTEAEARLCRATASSRCWRKF